MTRWTLRSPPSLVSLGGAGATAGVVLLCAGLALLALGCGRLGRQRALLGRRLGLLRIMRLRVPAALARRGIPRVAPGVAVQNTLLALLLLRWVWPAEKCFTDAGGARSCTMSFPWEQNEFGEFPHVKHWGNQMGEVCLDRSDMRRELTWIGND